MLHFTKTILCLQVFARCRWKIIFTFFSDIEQGDEKHMGEFNLIAQGDLE